MFLISYEYFVFCFLFIPKNPIILFSLLLVPIILHMNIFFYYG